MGLSEVIQLSDQFNCIPFIQNGPTATRHCLTLGRHRNDVHEKWKIVGIAQETVDYSRLGHKATARGTVQSNGA